MKLLVTTDFSTNSKAAIRFAHTLSKQAKNTEIIFYHAVQIMKPTAWNNVFFNAYKNEEIERLTEVLKKFISLTIGEEISHLANIKYIVNNCITTENDIITYAEKNKIDFICIATKGAGVLRKVMGTHTSYLVNNSKIPVMVIPSHYKAKTISKLTYLSDFSNLKNEVLKISKFSTPISLPIEVLHYSSIIEDKKKLEKNKELFQSKEFENISLNIQKSNIELSLVERISKYVRNSKPELLIMFTNRDKGFFESIFLPSKSAELTFTTKVPVLIYSK
jgi:nucleotide-binding universal stress UspA family protein